MAVLVTLSGGTGLASPRTGIAGLCARGGPTPLYVTTLNGYASLSDTEAGLFADPAAGDLTRSREWLQNFERDGLRPSDRLRIFAVRAGEGDETMALFPAIYSRLYASHPKARVLHFTLPEDQDYSPLVPRDQTLPAGAGAAVVAALSAARGSYDVIRLGPLPPTSGLVGEVVAALRRTGHFVQIYPHRPARYENVAGMTSRDYLAARPRMLRESLELNTRLLFQGGRGRFSYPVSPALLADASEDVQRVIRSARADAEADPPAYLAGMMALAVNNKALRLGIFYLDDEPVAMQFWIVGDHVARCLRIWGAEGRRAFPIDDVLTQMMAVCLIDGDRVAELNFGIIDDDFARNWAPQVRERIGIAAFTSRTLRGLRGAIRHVALPRLKALPGRLKQRLRRSARR